MHATMFHSPFFGYMQLILMFAFIGQPQVHLDHKHMGIGGDDSWSPCVHDKYMLPPLPCAFSIRFFPITAATSPHDIYMPRN